MISAIVLAGGSGTRMGTDTKKQFITLLDKPVLAWSLVAFQNSCADEIVLVCAPEDEDYCRKEIVEKYHISKCRKYVEGGRERYFSVINGLKKCNGDYVMIHDGARPCITPETINKAADILLEKDSCSVGTKPKDTIGIRDEEGRITDVPFRENMWISQTPQCFRTEDIAEGYRKALEEGEQHITDDNFVAVKYSGIKVCTLDGGNENIKITFPEDMETARNILSKRARKC